MNLQVSEFVPVLNESGCVHATHVFVQNLSEDVAF
jgi:hypothetical protein